MDLSNRKEVLREDADIFFNKFFTDLSDSPQEKSLVDEFWKLLKKENSAMYTEKILTQVRFGDSAKQKNFEQHIMRFEQYGLDALQTAYKEVRNSNMGKAQNQGKNL